MTRDSHNASSFPGRFPLSSPFETFNLSRRKINAVYPVIECELALGVSMKENRHELQDECMIVDCALESGPTLIGSKGNRGNGSAAIMDGNCEPAANTKASRFLE